MKILVVDNSILRDSFGAREFTAYGKLFPKATFFVRRAPERDLPTPAETFDRIVITGSLTSILDESQWTRDLEKFLVKRLEAGVPCLGICYGHQILARALGGMTAVRKAKRPEHGWTRIEQMENSVMFRGLNTEFYSFSSHYEEVSRLPEQCRAVGRSESCELQALEWDALPAWGVQFHPERDLVGADRTYEHQKKKGLARDFLNYNRGKQLYRPEVGETIMRNFLTHEF